MDLTDFISKPVDPEKLEYSVKSYLPKEKVISFDFGNTNEEGEAVSKNPIDNGFMEKILVIKDAMNNLDVDEAKKVLSKLSEYELNDKILGFVSELAKAVKDIDLNKVDEYCFNILDNV